MISSQWSINLSMIVCWFNPILLLFIEHFIINLSKLVCNTITALHIVYKYTHIIMDSTSNLSNKDVLHYVKKNSITKTIDVLLRTNQHLNEGSLRSSITRLMSKHSNLMKSRSKVNGTFKVEEFEHQLFVLPVCTACMYCLDVLPVFTACMYCLYLLV